MTERRWWLCNNDDKITTKKIRNNKGAILGYIQHNQSSHCFLKTSRTGQLCVSSSSGLKSTTFLFFGEGWLGVIFRGIRLRLGKKNVQLFWLLFNFHLDGISLWSPTVAYGHLWTKNHMANFNSVQTPPKLAVQDAHSDLRAHGRSRSPTVRIDLMCWLSQPCSSM